MNITKNRAVGAATISAAALLLAACGSSGSSSSTTSASGSTSGKPAADITIAGVYGMTFDPFWVSLGCGAKAEASKLGVTYKDFSSPSGDASAFSQNFQSATATKPTGIFVNPANPNQFITQYQTLMAAGTPVVTINGTTPAAQYKIVGTDVTDTSFLSQVTALVPSGTTGKMLTVNGIPGLVPVDVRLKPVVGAIKTANPGLTELPTVYSGFDVNKATAAVSSQIIANPDLKVIVAADGPDGQAAAAAVKTAGKAGQITVIALDATPAEVSALKDGTITGLVAQAPAQIGAQQLKTLVDQIQANPNGGAVTASSDFVGVPQKLLTKDNVGAAENADWVYTAKC